MALALLHRRWPHHVCCILRDVCPSGLPRNDTLAEHWLSDEERRLAMKRVEEDAGVGDERETEVAGFAAGLKMLLKDWSVWWFAVASAA